MAQLFPQISPEQLQVGRGPNMNAFQRRFPQLHGLLGSPGGGGLLGNQDLAMALLANSGYGPKRSFGQVLGTSMQQAQQMGQERDDSAFKRKYMEAQIGAMQSKHNNPFGAIDPDQFTSESLAEFQHSGNYGVLKRRGGLSGIGNFNPGDYTPASFAKFMKSQDANDLVRYVTPSQPSVQVVNGAPTVVTPDRTGATPPKQAPLSTQESEIEAAARLAREKASASAVGAIEGDRSVRNPRAYETFKTGMANIESTLANTVTGPVMGRSPAFTAAQQTAEGAEAIMAPVLKTLFRESGEGTFTKDDQAVLMAMLPTRKDHAESRASKIAMIDAIVKAKLGMAAAPSPGNSAGAPAVGTVKGGYRFKGGNPADKASWEPVK
jgi:hypothetical protein